MSVSGCTTGRTDQEGRSRLRLAQQNINQDSDSEYPAWYAVPEDGGVYNHQEPSSGQFSPGKTASTRAQSADPSPADRQSGGFGSDFLGREPEDIRPDWAKRDSETDADVPDPVRNILSSSGRKLSSPIKDDIEEKMGESFNDVRIHTGPEATEAAEAVNARAFTAGNHIVFNSGEFRPDTPEGKYVLAHEMAHVTQQTGGALSLLPQPDSELKVDPDQQLEREADQAAREALSDGENPQIQRLPGTTTEVHIQRIPEEKVFDAIGMFKSELEEGEISDHRESHDRNQLAFLQEVAQNILDKHDKKDELETKQTLQESDSRGKQQVAKRLPSEAAIKSEIERLTQNIEADLEDVALTDDQRQKLSTFDGGEFAKTVGWTTVKGLLSIVPGLGPAVAAYDISETALKKFWEQTSGSLPKRLKQVKEAVLDEGETASGDRPERVPSSEEV